MDCTDMANQIGEAVRVALDGGMWMGAGVFGVGLVLGALLVGWSVRSRNDD